jgi:hypothetical protein
LEPIVENALLLAHHDSVYKMIPWNKFREEEIIELLMLHFALLRFATHTPHFADPSHESGIDLEATKGDTRIAVAVKKHPKGADRAQLGDLSRTKASARIYVYISSPTEAFRNEMRRRRNIQFWDVRELSLQLVKSGVVFDLLLDNSALMKTMKDIFTIFLEWGDGSETGEIPPLTAEELAVFWSLKDRCVQLNKGSGLVQLLLERGYERRKQGRDIELREELLDLCSTALQILYRDAALPMLRLVSTRPDFLRFGAHTACSIDPARSNWKGLRSFVYERKGNVQGNILGDEKPSDRIAPIVFHGEPISALRMHDASSVFRVVGMYALDLEGVIDDIFDLAREKPMGSAEREFSNNKV